MAVSFSGPTFVCLESFIEALAVILLSFLGLWPFACLNFLLGFDPCIIPIDRGLATSGGHESRHKNDLQVQNYAVEGRWLSSVKYQDRFLERKSKHRG